MDVFFGAVVKDADAHFLTVRRGKFLDAARIEGRAKPFLRVQSGTDRFLLLFRHILTPDAGFPEIGPLIHRWSVES